MALILLFRTVIFGTRVPYKQNCHTSISFILKYHTIPCSLTSPLPKWPRRLAWETYFSRTSRTLTLEKTATSSRLPHDFSSGQSYHGIRMEVIRPVLHNLPCYLHRTYQVSMLQQLHPFKVTTVFYTQVRRFSMCKIPWYLHISYQGICTSTSPGQSYHGDCTWVTGSTVRILSWYLHLKTWVCFGSFFHWSKITMMFLHNLSRL